LVPGWPDDELSATRRCRWRTRTRDKARFFRWAGGGLLSILVVSRARSAEAAPTLNVECPAFDDGVRAELEARARAELAAYGPWVDEALVGCDARGVRVALRGPAEAPRAMVAHEGADSVTIDEILSAIHALLDSHDLPDPSPPAQSPARDVPTVEAAAEALPTRPPARSGIVAGMDAELWRGAIEVAVGAHAGARFSWADGWSATVLGGVLWGVGSPNGVRARAFQCEAVVEYAPASHLLLGAGAGLRALDAYATSQLVNYATSDQLVGVTAGGLATARYAVSAGPLAVSAGPVVEALLRPIVVQYSGGELFRMPQVVAGVGIDASLRP
jgi:hypothetical protein